MILCMVLYIRDYGFGCRCYKLFESRWRMCMGDFDFDFDGLMV